MRRDALRRRRLSGERTCRTLWASRASGARWARGTGRAYGSGYPRDPLRTSGPGRASRTGGTGGASRACGTGGTSWAGRAGGASRTGGTGRTLRAGGAFHARDGHAPPAVQAVLQGAVKPRAERRHPRLRLHRCRRRSHERGHQGRRGNDRADQASHDDFISRPVKFEKVHRASLSALLSIFSSRRSSCFSTRVANTSNERTRTNSSRITSSSS
jgi:hypothetical protein